MFIRKLYNLNRVLRNQYKPLSELINMQDKKIRFLIKYLYKHNKFYHDLYKNSNIDISKIKTKKDLKKLPIVTKADLQKHTKLFMNKTASRYLQNKRHKGLVIRRTGGSTGTPMFVSYDSPAWDFSEAIYARSLFGTGYKPYEKMVLSYPFLLPKRRWFEYIGLINKEYISMNLDISKQLEKLSRQKRQVTFYTYPTLLRILSKKLDKPQKIKRIISTGEILTEESRRQIESVFRCPVHNHYGSMECNRIAWECVNREGLHMDVDAHCIEFIKDNAEVNVGERGRMIITNLHNFSFPLVRYDQGDLGIPINDKCSCGRTLPLIKEIQGRDNDFIKLEKDESISPILIDVPLSKIQEILQFKLVQKNINKFDLFIIKNINYNDGVSDNIKRTLKKILKNDNIEINFKFVDEIPRSTGGKLRSIISLV